MNPKRKLGFEKILKIAESNLDGAREISEQEKILPSDLDWLMGYLDGPYDAPTYRLIESWIERIDPWCLNAAVLRERRDSYPSLDLRRQFIEKLLRAKKKAIDPSEVARILECFKE